VNDDEKTPTGHITITVPYTEDMSGMRGPDGGTWRDARGEGVFVFRNHRSLAVRNQDIVAALLKSWSKPRVQADYAKMLAEIEARQASIDALADMGHDDGELAHGDRGWLLAQIRAASEALTAAGIPGDGRPLAERVKALGEHALVCAKCGVLLGGNGILRGPVEPLPNMDMDPRWSLCEACDREMCGESIPRTPPPGGHDGPIESADAFFADEPAPPTCDHAAVMPAFDEEAAKGLDAYEVRKRWPRFFGKCPSCDFNGIMYASRMHYIMGDW
jgi:hypothetical protein